MMERSSKVDAKCESLCVSFIKILTISQILKPSTRTDSFQKIVRRDIPTRTYRLQWDPEIALVSS